MFRDANLIYRGYILERGRFREITAPEGAPAIPTAINDLGQVVGYYYAGGTYHGFVQGAGQDGMVQAKRPYRTAADGSSASTRSGLRHTRPTGASGRLEPGSFRAASVE